MKKTNRINMSLFDDELKALINASAKIFPISQYDIDTNFNPNGYEYGRIDNQIYRWNGVSWEYIIADDIDINWLDIKDKPLSYNPKSHNHNESDITDLDKYSKSEADTKFAEKNELHNHSNKSILDTIIQTVIDKWNSAFEHITDTIKHITSEERTLLNTVSNKTDKSYVDNALDVKADKLHDHDGAYYKKGEVDTKLNNKEDKLINRSVLDKITEVLLHDSYDISLLPELDERLFLIENGYSEGHAHSNLDTISKIIYTGLNQEVDLIDIENALSGLLNKANLIHDHSINDIFDMPTSMTPKPHEHSEADITDLDKYTKSETNNLLSSKVDKNYVDTELSKKANSTTLEGHIDNSTAHVTQTDKENLNTVYNSGFGRYISNNISTDADTTTLSGIYYLHSGATNKPPGIVDCALLVISYSDVWVTQLALDWRTNKQYSRVCSNKVWSAWQSIGCGATIGTVKPTDGSIWYELI